MLFCKRRHDILHFIAQKENQPGSILTIVAFAIILAALIIRCLFWRCPYCHEILPLNSMYSIVYCPDCGKKIW